MLVVIQKRGERPDGTWVKKAYKREEQKEEGTEKKNWKRKIKEVHCPSRGGQKGRAREVRKIGPLNPEQHRR